MDVDSSGVQDTPDQSADLQTMVREVQAELLGHETGVVADQPTVGSPVGPVQSPTNLEHRARLAADQVPPTLPNAVRARGTVPSILSRSDAELVASAFADLNRLHRAAQDAYTEGNSVFELVATKAALQGELMLLKMRHGTNVTINATIKNQSDLPPYGGLPPEVRQQVSQLLNVVDAEVVEDDFSNYADTNGESAAC